MAERKREWPEVGDLVITPRETVKDYRSYAKLDEYPTRGLVRTTEISSEEIGESIISNVINSSGQGTFRRER
jgi:translation initiation factor 2 alpha subunit (eIF-2alpha)